MLQKKKDTTSTKVLAAGIAGAAIGAVGILMSDKKNRDAVEKNVGKTIDDVKKWSDATVGDLKKKVDTLDLPEKAGKVKDEVKNVGKKAEDMTEKESSNIGE
jgi:hypothetical protein